MTKFTIEVTLESDPLDVQEGKILLSTFLQDRIKEFCEHTLTTLGISGEIVIYDAEQSEEEGSKGLVM